MLAIFWFAFSRQTDAHGYFLSSDMKEIYYMSEDGSKEVITANDYDKFNLLVSPERELLGYFQSLHQFGEDDYKRNTVDEEAYWNNYIGLFVVGARGENFPKEIYRGDNKVRAWEWIDDSRVIIYRSCGSPCDSYSIVNTNGYVLQKPDMLGLGHELSPDKKWLTGYASWPGEIGVRVRNIDTGEEHAFIRTHGKAYQYADYIKALWSDDNRLLAVVNKKEGASDLEAIVYDTNRDFRVFRRETIRCEIIDDDLQCDLIDGLERFLSDMLKRAGA